MSWYEKFKTGTKDYLVKGKNYASSFWYDDYNTSFDYLEEYGSFAGEFNVNGTVKLNVFTYKWEMDGNQSVEQYESISDEGEL